MRALRELGSRIIRSRKERERLENEKKFIAAEIAMFIVEKAAVILFNTPVPTEIPTDSFAEDYDVNFVRLVEKDLKLDELDDINRAGDGLQNGRSSARGQGSLGSRSKGRSRKSGLQRGRSRRG